MSLLIQNGDEDVSAFDTALITSMSESFRGYTSMPRYDKVAELLIQNGANVNAVGGEFGSTALIWAARRGKDQLSSH